MATSRGVVGGGGRRLGLTSRVAVDVELPLFLIVINLQILSVLSK